MMLSRFASRHLKPAAIARGRKTIVLRCTCSTFSTDSESKSTSTDFSATSNEDFGVYGDSKINYIDRLEMQVPKEKDNIPIYRILDVHGKLYKKAKEPKLNQKLAVRLYTDMVKLSIMDQILNDTQRQGRISFYMTSNGEEAATVGSASALNDADMIFGQYREAGALLWRGFTFQNFADQCFSNVGDSARGRQMPIHYGSKELNFQTISSPLGTQLPQAVGAAYHYKLNKLKLCAMVYFGEGAASEGDFHPALNFAATLDCPVIFFCRNNGYAISTPSREQYRGDGIASRAAGYGMACIRVDGNDILAVRQATELARKYAIDNSKPVLVEAMSYRQGHHSTSDDSTRYRSIDEIEDWRLNAHPIDRFRGYLLDKAWWDEEQDKQLVAEQRKEVLEAVNTAEQKEKPEIMEDLFNDVYDELPAHLQQQKAELKQHLKKYGDQYSMDH